MELPMIRGRLQTRDPEDQELRDIVDRRLRHFSGRWMRIMTA
jgi:hypothetical protein